LGEGQPRALQVPREIVFVDELPRNATSKILKRELEDHQAG
jgi:acyl-coenzyme A synthetase/AMP-(fatty) acid ligase